MKKLNPLFLLLLLAFNAFGHGGDDGPSSLEEEFAKLAHFHLPINYSTTHGLSFNYQVGGHKEEPGHEEADDHGDETGLEVNIHPVFFVGYDRISRVVSLEESKTNDLEIEAASDEGEFLLLENRKWDLGIGLESEIHLPIPLMVVGIGVTYLKGKTYYTLRRLSSRHEKRSPLMLPVSAGGLSTWRTGDELSYATKGSIIFNAFIGIEPFIHIGPDYIHTGTYRFKARLVSEELLEVQITTTSTHSFGIEGSALLFNAEASKGKGHLESITYQFDLKNQDSFNAISALFHGRLDLTNREMMKSGGRIRVKTSLQNRSMSVTGNFGLPAIYINGGSVGRYHLQGRIEDHEEGETEINEITSTTSMKEHFTRGLLSRHKWENQTIVSTVLRGDHPLLSVFFSWSLGREGMSAPYIMKKLSRLSQTFERPRLSELQFPDLQLGYLKADFGVNFSGADVLYLLNGTELKTLMKDALSNLGEDFRTYGHRAFCRVRSYTSCLQRYQNLILNKHQRLLQLRRQVEAGNQQGQMPEVTSGLNQMVKELFSSRYLTRSFLKRRPELKIELRLEGERIKKHVLTL